jgi:hypothetical protein
MTGLSRTESGPHSPVLTKQVTEHAVSHDRMLYNVESSCIDFYTERSKTSVFAIWRVRLMGSDSGQSPILSALAHRVYVSIRHLRPNTPTARLVLNPSRVRSQGPKPRFTVHHWPDTLVHGLVQRLVIGNNDSSSPTSPPLFPSANHQV